MMGLAGYGGSTAAGPGVDALWTALQSGTDFTPARWPEDSSPSSFERLLHHLMLSYREACSKLERSEFGRLGVILVSTKGFVEDSIWSAGDEELAHDLISPLLPEFCKRAELTPVTRAVISNACSSTLSALWLAQAWLDSGRADTVLVLSVDEVGPFVQKGFQALHALTSGVAKPFSANRDGLKLGAGAAALILTRRTETPLCVSGVAIDAEGYAVTRPSPSGESLKRCLRALPSEPDLILAHGTGTILNDAVEDQVFFDQYGTKPWVTGSKWSIGHTLAACGALDLILAGEAISRRSSFRLANTPAIDPSFRSRYLTAGSTETVAPNRVLVSSLGFGGIHAAAMVERRAL